MPRTYIGYTQTAENADLDALALGTTGAINVTKAPYNAVGDNVADDAAAFAAALAAGVDHVFVPAGQYNLQANVPLPGTGRFIFEGVGIESRIDFNPSANNLAMFSATEGDTLIFRNLNFVLANSGSRTGCVAIDLADADISDITFENCYFTGWNAYAVKLTGGTYVKFDKCRFNGNKAASGSPAVCIYSTSFINNLTIRDTRFLNNDKVLRCTNSYAIDIAGCAFESDGTTSTATVDSIIEVQAYGFDMSGCYVEDEEPGSGYAFLQLTNTGGANISGTAFIGQFGAQAVTGRHIYVNGADGRGIVVEGCRFDTAVTAFVDSDNNVVRVKDCSFYQLGTGELTTHNAVMALMEGPIELNNLLTSTTVDVPEILDGDAYNSADVAVTGAALGDEVRVTADVDLQGLQLSGYVRTAGQCRFTLVNNTGGAINLGSATYYLRLIRRDT